MVKQFFKQTILFLVAAVPAFADTPVPISRDAYALRLPGGSGQDMERIEVMATEEDFGGGRYFIRFNPRTMALGNYLLPVFRMSQKCEFHRSSGGSVGDYKPKSMIFRIGIADPAVRRFADLWTAGRVGEDYNENPVSREFNLNLRDSRIELSLAVKNMLREKCFSPAHGPRTMIVTFKSDGLCRWKPENWHKPENFPFEYRPELDANVTKLILLECL